MILMSQGVDASKSIHAIFLGLSDELNFHYRGGSMAYAKYSTEQKLDDFLRDENTTTMFVGTLAFLRKLKGLSQTRLSAVQRGKPLENEAAIELRKLLLAMEQLRNAAKPIPVRFHNAADINGLLNLMEEGRLTVIVIAPDTDAKPLVAGEQLAEAPQAKESEDGGQ